MRIVVFGATGYVGGHITSELRARGHEVVSVARSGDVTAIGSVFDPDFVREVTEGADAVVSALPALTSDGQDVGDAMEVLAAVSAEHGSMLTGVGGAAGLPLVAGGPRLVENDGLPPIVRQLTDAHDKAIAVLRSAPAELEWFYLVPPMDFGPQSPGERTGDYRLSDDALVVDSEGRSCISGPDYAVAFADELERPTSGRRVFTVGY